MREPFRFPNSLAECVPLPSGGWELRVGGRVEKLLDREVEYIRLILRV